MSEVTYNRVNWKDTPSTETPINATNLNKMDKGIADVTAAVNECFQSASEGKTLIAAALTGKGQASTVADTFAQMAAKIGNLMAVPTATKNITANGNNIDVKNYAKVNVNVVTPIGVLSAQLIGNGAGNYPYDSNSIYVVCAAIRAEGYSCVTDIFFNGSYYLQEAPTYMANITVSGNTLVVGGSSDWKRIYKITLTN